MYTFTESNFLLCTGYVVSTFFRHFIGACIRYSTIHTLQHHHAVSFPARISNESSCKHDFLAINALNVVTKLFRLSTVFLEKHSLSIASAPCSFLRTLFAKLRKESTPTESDNNASSPEPVYRNPDVFYYSFMLVEFREFQSLRFLLKVAKRI